MNNKTKVVTKINRLEDKANDQWTTYNIGAEATNVYGRNGDRGRHTAQSLLLKDMPPVEYVYGQDIYNASDNTFEPLTWESIQRWLNEGIIREFLKEGDCIKVPLQAFALGSSASHWFPTYWYFWVIGINTHNGQSTDALSDNLQHIDFCGGSYAILNDAAKNLANVTITAASNSPTFLNISSNNGRNIAESDSYGNFFVDNPLIKKADSESDTLNYGDKTIEVLATVLGMPNTILYFSPKTLYLDQRYTFSFDVLDSFCSDIVGVNTNLFIEQLANTYKDILELSDTYTDAEASDFSTVAKGKYRLLLQQYNRFFGNGTGWTSSNALAMLRYSVQLGHDDFLDFIWNEKISSDWHDSNAALRILRWSIGFTPVPVLTDANGQAYFSEIINYYTDPHPNNNFPETYGQPGNSDYCEDFSKYANTIEVLDYFCQLCEAAYWWGGNAYKTHSEKAEKHPQLELWGLTEKEFFGECTFSKPEFAQGQIFQYPIFQNMVQRMNITKDLKARSNSNENVRMIFVNPAEESNTDAVGLDIESLVPTTYSVVTTKADTTKTYPIDMPICFRMQQNAEDTTGIIADDSGLM